MWHFGRVLAFGGVLAVLTALAAPTEVVAQKKKAVADNGYGATPEDYKQIQSRKELTGTIVTASGKVVTIRVDTPHMEPNPKFKPVTNPKAAGYNPQSAQQYRLVQDAQKLQRDLVQAQNANTPQERARAMQRYYQDMARFQQQSQQQYNQLMAKAAKSTAGAKGGTTGGANDPFILVHSYKEFDLETEDNLVVRKMFLALEYDDMGNLKKYTDKELAELRGDDKSKKGYKSKMEEIVAGMEATLTLIPVKKKKNDAKPDDDAVGNVDRPTISQILLTKDNPTPVSGAVDPKKKKKN